MVAADGGAQPLQRSDEGIRLAHGRTSVPARRHLAQFFHQVLRIEPAAQEDAARVREGSPVGGPSPIRQSVSGGARKSHDASAAQPVQRCVLARGFWGTLFPASANYSVA